MVRSLRLLSVQRVRAASSAFGMQVGSIRVIVGPNSIPEPVDLTQLFTGMCTGVNFYASQLLLDLPAFKSARLVQKACKN
jgi:hypothetical protein